MSESLERIRAELIALLPRLRRFARTLTRNTHDADDLVQIAIERALTRHAQWRVGTRVDSWLFGILRNAFIDELRSRERRGQLFVPEELGDSVGDDSGERGTEMQAIRQALQQLPEEQRSVVSLVLIEGLSYQEAADALAVPIGTVTSRLARGRSALQALLADGGAS